MGKGTATSGEVVVRLGFNREVRFVLKPKSEICGGKSLGNVESTTRMVGGKESSRGLKGGIKKNHHRFISVSSNQQVKMMKRRGLVPLTRSMSDIPEDLVAEILSRVPMTSLRSLRSTCKNWNSLSRNQIFGKVAEAKNLFFGFVLINCRMYSLRIDHKGLRYDYGDLCFKQVSVLNQVNQLQVLEAYQCDGLFLFSFITDKSRLLVWNPYLGQTRWIQYERKPFSSSYALGYDNNNRNHKILEISEFGYSIYELNANSWKVFDFTRTWKLPYRFKQSVNLKGNTFFFAVEEEEYFLLAFDFTSERFGARLSLPFHYSENDILTLSCVKDEKLAVLVQFLGIWDERKRMEIWITTKIDCNEVVWTKWMQVEFGVCGQLYCTFPPYCESFLIDEETKVAVVFDQKGFDHDRFCRIHRVREYLYRKSRVFGEEDGYYLHLYSFCSQNPKLLSYAPSLVQIE